MEEGGTRYLGRPSILPSKTSLVRAFMSGFSTSYANLIWMTSASSQAADADGYSLRDPEGEKISYISDKKRVSKEVLIYLFKVKMPPEVDSNVYVPQTSDRNFLPYRRFGTLHSRLLSDLQSQIEDLEQELDNLDVWDAQNQGTDARRKQESCSRNDKSPHPSSTAQRYSDVATYSKPEIMSMIKQKLKEYDDVLLKVPEVVRKPLMRPSARQRNDTMRQWLQDVPPLVSPSKTLVRINRPCDSYPTIPGKINGRKVAPLGDLGASHNYISEAYALRCGHRIEPETVGAIKLANGKDAMTVGTSTLSFVLEGDTAPHLMPFKVLRSCIHDVILGGSFLRFTETFTRFRERIRWQVHKLLTPRVNFLGSELSQQYMQGWFDGEPVFAMPDTGSQVMLVSEEYALRQRHEILRDKKYRLELQFGDGSNGFTEGIVKNVNWSYDDFGETHVVDFYVLKDLPCDIILSCDFLFETQAFDKHADLLFDTTIPDWAWLNVIVNVTETVQRFKATLLSLRPKAGSREVNPPEASGQILSYEKESQVMMQRLEKLYRLPGDQQAAALVLWNAQWHRLQAKHGRVLDTGGSSGTLFDPGATV